MSIYCNIRKDFPNFHLNIEFQGDNEVLSLLGASGSGKSMILRCIAGIEKPDSGQIIVNGRVLFDSQQGINLSPQQRKTGLLFQDFALFPNMTVGENISIAMDAYYHLSLSQVLENYHLTEQENQYPYQLSGGQKQRCAIARMIVTNPDIILLDEPFSSLDSFLRFQLEKELFNNLRDFSKTIIFVSHNRDEVYRLSDKVSIIKAGQNIPMVEKQELFAKPQTYDGALLTGCKNIFKAHLESNIITIPKLHLTFNWEPSELTKDFQFIGMHANDLFYMDEMTADPKTHILFEVTLQDINEGLYSYYLTVKPQGATSTLLVEMSKDKFKPPVHSTGTLCISKERLVFLTTTFPSL